MPGIRGWDVRAVFLDLDDTLSDELHHMRSAYAAALRELPRPLSPARATATLAACMDIAIDLYRRNAWDEMSREARLDSALRRAGLEPGNLSTQIVQGYLKNYETGLKLFPGAVHLLEAASQHRTCLITNGNSDRQRQKLRLLGIEKRFDHILISEEFGASKPDAAIFRRALSLTDVEADQAVMIGDNALADIAGAAGLGIRTIWVNVHGWDLPSEGVEPDHEVPDAGAAAELLASPTN